MKIEFAFECREQVEGNYCNVCDHTIYDLSQMTDEEVETLLARKERVCGRGITVGGTVMTKTPKLWKVLTLNAAFFSLAACDTAPAPERPIAVESGVAVLEAPAVEAPGAAAPPVVEPTLEAVSDSSPATPVETISVRHDLDSLESMLTELQRQRTKRRGYKTVPRGMLVIPEIPQ